jgi:hypothetical protein
MSSRVAIADVSERQAARIAGLAYVAIIVLAFFANFFVLDRLIEPDDAATTVSNVRDSETSFRIAIAAFVVVTFADAVVAWALYVFLRRANRDLALLTAWFRLLYAAIFGTALLALLIALRFVNGTSGLSALEADQRNAQAKLFLDAFNDGWALALTFFGVHLLLLGVVILKSDYVPRLLGILLVVAGVSYLVRNLASVLVTNFEDYKEFSLLLVVVLAVPGEFGLPAWLLLRGAKSERGSHPEAGETEKPSLLEG